MSPGVHSITASYSGDTNNAVSASTPFPQAIAQITTATALSTSANPLSAGSTLHLNAVVTLAPGAAPSGTLAGTVTFKDGTTVLGTDVLDPAGHAVLSVPVLSVGTHPITAAYSGSTNYASSLSAAFNESVSITPTTVSVVSSTSSLLAGKPVDFSVTVSSTTGIPTGTVTLNDGPAILAQGTLSSSGTAALHVSALTVGSHALTMTYAGDANYATSTSSTIGVTVSLAQTAVTLSGPVTPVDAGTLVSLTGTVSSNGVTPSGTVTLRDGAATIATQTISISGNLAFSTDSLALGTHSLSLAYSGDANNSPVESRHAGHKPRTYRKRGEQRPSPQWLHQFCGRGKRSRRRARRRGRLGALQHQHLDPRPAHAHCGL